MRQPRLTNAEIRSAIVAAIMRRYSETRKLTERTNSVEAIVHQSIRPSDRLMDAEAFTREIILPAIRVAGL